jgi:phosphoglycerate dehydrogenase-like enzyme
MIKIAVLDDWQRIAENSADWSGLKRRAEVTFFYDAFASADAAAERLAAFDILLTMRERTAFPAALVRRLPKLRMLGITGARNASIDMAALGAQGVTVCFTSGGGSGAATAELTLGLILAAARRIPAADAATRAGRFQAGIAPGFELAGRTLGIIGLGRLGSRLARYAQALEMRTIAWSPNLTPERAAAAGAAYVSKEELLATADIVSLHLVLSERSRGIIGAADLARMQPGALLVNTSRGPLVDEAALVAALHSSRLAAALDVFDREPLPAGHPLLSCPNLVMTPHLGYGSAETFKDFYRQSIENAIAFLDGKPVRVLGAAKA